METSKERLFYNTLRDVFIGERIEGSGGYINLMKIKSKHYQRIEKVIKQDIQELTKKYPSFKNELYDRLYSFFKNYFSESGSIYLNPVAVHNQVYEKVYTNKDISLFWKTQGLYYIKTDRLFKSLTIEIDGKNIFFDASEVEYKKHNEKRSLFYEFYKVEKNTLHLKVFYKEGNRKTDIESIIKKSKESGLKIKEEELRRAIRTFERQSEVDYFINKNARKFLKEQFDLWLYRHLTNVDNQWTLERIEQIQGLKKIAYKLIDFVGQFEEELAKIWEKPRFVRKSNYVISLDRIASKGGWRIIEKLPSLSGWKEQVREWMELGMLKKEPESLLEGKELKKEYRFLPLDTKYFKEVEPDILGLFDDLDEELDGWLIKSENWQALNTILPKFRGKVQTIYIDPPFNLEESNQFLYLTNYKDSTWATLLDNRISLAKEFLKESGAIFVRCDYNGNCIVKGVLDRIFGEENFRNELIIKRKRQAMGSVEKFEVEHEYLYLYSKSKSLCIQEVYAERDKSSLKWTGFLKQGDRNPPERVFIGKVLYPPKGQHFSLNQEKVNKLLKEHFLRLRCKTCKTIYYYDEKHSKEAFKLSLNMEDVRYKDLKDKNVLGVSFLDKCLVCNDDSWKVEYMPRPERKIGSLWTDIPSYSDNWNFPTENSEKLLERVIKSTSEEGDLIMDFFAGSGTTCAVSYKENRKFIGIEMGEHFYNVVIPRMKITAKEHSSKTGRKGIFMKYYELEQYEEILARASYCDDVDDELFSLPVFAKDEKLLHIVGIDYEKEGTIVKLSDLYLDIDIAETLSIAYGCWIKELKDGSLLLENGISLRLDDINSLDTAPLKPFLWWY